MFMVSYSYIDSAVELGLLNIELINKMIISGQIQNISIVSNGKAITAHPRPFSSIQTHCYSSV